MGLKINLKKRETKRNIVKSEKKTSFGNKVLNKTLSLLLKTPVVGSILKIDSSSVILSSYEITSERVNKNMSILFISDMHLEVVDNSNFVRNLVLDKKFDYVILGGDVFDNDKNALLNKDRFENLIKILSEKSKNGVVSVLGNHDGCDTAELLNEKTSLLINDFIEDDNIFIYGTEDPVLFSETEDFDGRVPDDKFSLLISHSPNFYKKIKNRYDLMLSGHTHGGQVSIFGYTPLNYCEDKKMIYGEWEKDGMRGITSSGLGCSGLPVRIGIKPEIVEIKIRTK